jgi:DNA-binding CsgD family transcriptional regulator
MYFSTKEIASILNISTRGVEISRYRLRKKMELDAGTNLTDYLSRL